ncbi:MAG TPA: FAD-dependent monooxygenase [Candidatus Acidoferrales bacterium]|nr:FAD-dependent monooxygenase [Candidatus Acidoferrales bacterium]
MSSSNYDALVIGGGPGGATTAVLLAKAGWRVAVVEMASFPRGKVCGEFVSASNFPLLSDLGVADSFVEHAGPEVRQVGLFAGDHTITANMPRARKGDGVGRGWGRALGRDRLDTLLLRQAAACGAHIRQPWSVVGLVKNGEGCVCKIVSRERGEFEELRAQIVVAAHGSWGLGPLPTQPARSSMRPSDLFGFKAHFQNSRLPPGLMPLLAFPGGYGGMVHSDHGRVSLSCCVRRDQLEKVRGAAGLVSAGKAVLAHILRNCLGAREALDGATLEGNWFSAGPIRPGIRRRGFENIFLVGNAAGEAHPVVAEGIGMAMQSASLLCERLGAQPAGALSARAVQAVQADYAAAWRRNLAPRIHVASLIAHWAMRPVAVECVIPLLRQFPAVLTAGARFSGKATPANVSEFRKTSFEF